MSYIYRSSCRGVKWSTALLNKRLPLLRLIPNSHYRGSDRSIPNLRCFDFVLPKRMAIDGCGDGDTRMSETLRDDWQRNTIRQELAAMGMPKRVQAHSLQAELASQQRNLR